MCCNFFEIPQGEPPPATEVPGLGIRRAGDADGPDAGINRGGEDGVLHNPDLPAGEEEKPLSFPCVLGPAAGKEVFQRACIRPSDHEFIDKRDQSCRERLLQGIQPPSFGKCEAFFDPPGFDPGELPPYLLV